MQDPSPSVSSSVRTLPQLLRARALLGEALATPLAARFSFWLHGAITLYYCFQAFAMGRAGLSSALGSLALPALFATSAFFGPVNAVSPLFQLAHMRGLSTSVLRGGVFLARTWLALRPFLFSVPLLWLCTLGADSALSAWLTLPLGIAASLGCAVGLAVCLAAMAWLSEHWSKERPGRLLLALLLVPAFLKPAVPELPSVWHGYHAWTQWAVGHVERV